MFNIVFRDFVMDGRCVNRAMASHKLPECDWQIGSQLLLDDSQLLIHYRHWPFANVETGHEIVVDNRA